METNFQPPHLGTFCLPSPPRPFLLLIPLEIPRFPSGDPLRPEKWFPRGHPREVLLFGTFCPPPPPISSAQRRNGFPNKNLLARATPPHWPHISLGNGSSFLCLFVFVFVSSGQWSSISLSNTGSSQAFVARPPEHTFLSMSKCGSGLQHDLGFLTSCTSPFCLCCHFFCRHFRCPNR